MKIGIDATPLSNQLTGIGNYLFFLLKEMVLQRPSDQFFLYATHSSHALQFFTRYSNVKIRLNRWLSFSEALWSQTTLSWMCYRDDLDIFWGPTQSIPLLSTKKVRQLITIHDFTYRLFPETVSTGRRVYLRWFGKIFYKRAAVRFVISQGTANRLHELYSLRADAVIVPPLKEAQIKNEESLLQQLQLKKKEYFLIVGTIEPRKNLFATLEVYCELLQSGNHALLSPLVVVGKEGWKNFKSQKTIERWVQCYPEHLKILGYLSDQALNTLVKEARACLMTSLYEGYGMPIAEARALGTAVICSDQPEMVEAAEGDGHFIPTNRFKEELQRAFLNPPEQLNRAVSYPSTQKLALNMLAWFYS